MLPLCSSRISWDGAPDVLVHAGKATSAIIKTERSVMQS